MTEGPQPDKYPLPTAYADRGQAKPLIKLIGKMALGKRAARGIGVVSSSNVKVKQKKVKYW